MLRYEPLKEYLSAMALIFLTYDPPKRRIDDSREEGLKILE